MGATPADAGRITMDEPDDPDDALFTTRPG
jgi:hypothetical protein